MSTRLLLSMVTLTGSLVIMTGTAGAEQNTSFQLAEAGAELENTGRNVRDKDDANLTPADQKENEHDIKITATIRQAVVKDETLSVNAQNAKIISRHGVVTLRGPVETEVESLKLHKIATETPGVVQVDNQLEIKAP
ncbi:BON domain-containing protein [Methylicorpusculum oleiharenae]|uniref:BON domain-containing protein n=1 Tax=Methylicorpusculum oleiharenae TaxID=1338687 RepID=UPI001358C3E8|nr:BON domain-containing protein [Methylicorpusculum oleiharenae]MCD2451178.1 BON domain-containing protein [Methylicorpusculum oleiharenae]